MSFALKGMLPVEPFREIILEYLKTAEYDDDLSRLLWPDSDIKTRCKRLHAVLHEQKWIGFDLADNLLCKLGLVELWQSDPVLSELYQSVDLFAYDVSYPVSETVADTIRSEIRAFHANIPSHRHPTKKTAEEFGIGKEQVRRIIRMAA